MRFESRELKPYAEPVPTDQLRKGAVYFAVSFADPELLIPSMEPKVFIGYNLDSGRSGHFHFQDLDSYQKGVRFGSQGDTSEALFETGTESHIFEYEKALDVLMLCALRRRETAFGPGDPSQGTK